MIPDEDVKKESDSIKRFSVRFHSTTMKTILILTPFFLVLLITEPALVSEAVASNPKYLLPIGSDRADYNKWIKNIIGRYGDYRRSHVKGHKHSGIDIRGNFGETVYSIGRGTVINIFREFPHKTIYIRHSESELFYSVYIHVEDIQVNIGDRVSENTPLARIFNRDELNMAEFGTPPHLHFEIRHNIDDKGDATFKSMTLEDLNKYCINPLKFFKKGTKIIRKCKREGKI